MLSLRFSEKELECGTDEAGRGCLAGPVVAAAVILKDNFSLEELNDSKLLVEKKRIILEDIIKKEALTFAITEIGPETIDAINILNSSILAMQESIKKLTPLPNFIIVDGNRFKSVLDIPYETIIKGDAKYQSIAAASILAKTHRDAYMEKIHEEFPVYNWKQNKGYPTKEHREAIRQFGVTKYHRMTFKLLPEPIDLPFAKNKTK
jgi:ribonuclease HII